MKRSVRLKPSEPPSRRFFRRSLEADLELWKHHASFGGEDKNRMVSIATWLLGGSAAVLWYILTSLDFTAPFGLKEPLRILGAAILGIGVSVLAVYVSLLYGRYSNQNWYKADYIARNRGWYDLLPLRENDIPEIELNGIAYRLNRLAIRWARPCKPEERLAPVFEVFFLGAMILFLLHLGWVDFSFGYAHIYLCGYII
jgi:hypothetical protein